MLHPRLLRQVTPKIAYIEPILDLTVDTAALLAEYRSRIEPLMQADILGSVHVQSRYHLMFFGQWQPCVDHMPYTRSVADLLRSHLPYNSVNYRIVQPNTAYNWHTDSGQCCLHIPLITNTGSRFVYEDRVFHLAAQGQVYQVNNSRPHTFVNAGPTPRLHITFETLVA